MDLLTAIEGRTGIKRESRGKAFRAKQNTVFAAQKEYRRGKRSWFYYSD